LQATTLAWPPPLTLCGPTTCPYLIATMTDTFRDLCAEITENLHKYTSLYEGHESELVTPRPAGDYPAVIPPQRHP